MARSIARQAAMQLLYERLSGGEADDDAGVVAFLSKLHDDTTAHSHLAFQSGGQEVSVGVLQGKRKKELDKHGQCGFAVVKVTG